MTSFEFLAQVQTLRRLLRYHLKRVNRMIEEEHRLPGFRSDLERVRATPAQAAPYVALVERRYDLEKLMDLEVSLLDRLEAQAKEAIAALPSEELRLVLFYRFLEGRSMNETGELFYVGKTTVRRWQAKALSLLVLPPDAVDLEKDLPKFGTDGTNGTLCTPPAV